MKTFMNAKWKYRFLELAKTISSWSKDPSRQIGAVIVNPTTRTILSLGYNGFPRNIEDKTERLSNREEKYKYVVHAEMNAIYNASYTGTKLECSHIFIHGLPICNECAKAIIQVGIESVVMPIQDIPEYWQKSWDISKTLFDEAGITYEFI